MLEHKRCISCNCPTYYRALLPISHVASTNKYHKHPARIIPSLLLTKPPQKMFVISPDRLSRACYPAACIPGRCSTQYRSAFQMPYELNNTLSPRPAIPRPSFEILRHAVGVLVVARLPGFSKADVM